jgi:hypothetical protein
MRNHRAEDSLARIARIEDNPSKGAVGGFGPVKRFPNKGTTSNPTKGGGINRPTTGKPKF